MGQRATTTMKQRQGSMVRIPAPLSLFRRGMPRQPNSDAILLRRRNVKTKKIRATTRRNVKTRER